MKQLTTAVLLSSLLVACGSVDDGAPMTEPTEPTEPADDVVTDPEPEPQPEPRYAETCAALHQDDPSAADGPYTLYLGGDKTKPWTAYCADMATAPIEYFVFAATG